MRNVQLNRLKFIPFLALALFLLLPLFGYLQFVWLSRLNESERESIRKDIENSVISYSFDFGHRFGEFVRTFKPVETEYSDIGEIKTNILSKISNWRKNRNSNLLDKAYIIDLKRSKAFLIEEDSKSLVLDSSLLDNPELKSNLAHIKSGRAPDIPSALMNNFSSIAFNADTSDKQNYFIYFTLNADYISNNFLKPLFEDFISQNKKYVVGLEIISSIDNRIIFQTQTGKINETLYIDSPIGLLPAINKAPKNFDSLDGEHNRNGDSINPLAARRNEFFRKVPPSIGRYKIAVCLNDKATITKYSISNYENLIISYAILALLAIISVASMLYAVRNQKIASQQLFFLAGLPHELRTPLSVIRSASQNLSDGIISNAEKTQKYGALILKETDRLWDIIETALMYAGLQNKQQLLTPAFHSIENVFSAIIKKRQEYILAKELILKQEFQKDMPLIYFDERLLNTALDNLVSNAIKFSKQNGKIVISAHIKKKYLFIEIKDFGIGFSKSDSKNIFNPFYRSKNALDSKIEGSGIGLTIVKNIIKAHRGDVKATCSANEGTIFKIKMPIK